MTLQGATPTVSFDHPTALDRPLPDGSDIHEVETADVEVIASALAQAFYDDPHMRWIFRDDGRRMRRLERSFATFIAGMWLEHGASYTHSRRIGAALWMPPGTSLSVATQLQVTPAVVRATGRDLVRLLRAFVFIERKHLRRPAHWYLPMIGVAPQWQGRGFGAALLRPVLEQCDRDRTPAYLEASTPRNRALYERHGFEVMEECSYAPGAPPLWLMWREPGA